MAYSAIDIAKKIVCKTDVEHGDTLSNLKLQKLLYYMQGFHLAAFDTPFFNEAIEAWTYGPVVPVVFREFKKHQNRAINPENYLDELALTGEEQQLFDRVYDKYNCFSAVALMQMTHTEGPWKSHKVGEVLTRNEIRDYFTTLPLPDQTPVNAAPITFDETYMQNRIQQSAPAWKGIADADAWIHELRGE